MAESKNPVGNAVNLDLLTKEIDKNNHKLKVCEFMNIYYLVMGELEEHHPVVQMLIKAVGEPAYNEYVCSIVFTLCMRLAQTTMNNETFEKLVDRITTETVELDLDKPKSTKELN